MKDEYPPEELNSYPRTRAEFEALFPDDEACLTYLARLRWPDGFVCPTCGPRRAWMKTRGRLVCSNCRRETTVTAGTLFDRTHKPLRTWFAAIWQISDRPGGVSVREFQQMLGLGSYKTAWAWLRRLQSVMVPHGRDLLAGTVEVDDFRLPSKGSGTGDGATSTGIAVVIAAEARGRSLGRARAARPLDLSQSSLSEFVRGAVEPGAVLRTDDFDGYSGLEAAGFRHRVVMPSKAGHQSQIAFASVRYVALALASWLQSVRSGPSSPPMLDYQLDEFSFRFNHRQASTTGEVFRLLLAEIAKGDEGPGRQLPRAV